VGRANNLALAVGDGHSKTDPEPSLPLSQQHQVCATGRADPHPPSMPSCFRKQQRHRTDLQVSGARYGEASSLGGRPRVSQTDLSGLRALVTGGGRGIGAACAQRLAQAGAVVIIADIDGERASSVAEELGGEAWQVDLADTEALAEVSLDVDVLVNNAGFQHVAVGAENLIHA
jgi:glutamyl-tRNA reductase